MVFFLFLVGGRTTGTFRLLGGVKIDSIFFTGAHFVRYDLFSFMRYGIPPSSIHHIEPEFQEYGSIHLSLLHVKEKKKTKSLIKRQIPLDPFYDVIVSKTMETHETLLAQRTQQFNLHGNS